MQNNNVQTQVINNISICNNDDTEREIYFEILLLKLLFHIYKFNIDSMESIDKN
jgi:hypothetical protein